MIAIDHYSQPLGEHDLQKKEGRLLVLIKRKKQMQMENPVPNMISSHTDQC